MVTLAHFRWGDSWDSFRIPAFKRITSPLLTMQSFERSIYKDLIIRINCFTIKSLILRSERPKRISLARLKSKSC